MGVHALVLACALHAATVGTEDPVPPKTATAVDEVDRAVRRGIALLLASQESLSKSETRGEWPYEGVYRVDRKIPIGYRVGGTAICATALIEAHALPSKASAKLPAKSEELPAAARAALDRAIDFVLEGIRAPLMSAGFEGGYDTRGWGHAYALGFLLRAREAGRISKKRQAAVDEAVRWLVDTLQKTEIKKRGGWNYSRGPDPDDAEPSTFMTAPALQFLFEAERQGEKIDREVVGRALDVLEAGRLETGAFQYAIDPTHRTGKGFEAVEGAIGRSPVCETTLFLAGRGSVERIRGALDAFFLHWEWLEKRRKQNGTHVAPFMIAPYYFFYAHRYAAQAIELLPEAERAERREKLLALLWKVREESGGWNDRAFPRSENFGTAMAMLALLAPELPEPARWSAPEVSHPPAGPAGK